MITDPTPRSPRRARARAITALAAAALLVTATACSSSGSSPKSASPTSVVPSTGSPVLAHFASLTGKATTVTLDKDFSSKLAALKVNLKPVGKATYDASAATISLPITGGNATFNGEGAASSRVQGTFQHAGSQLSLTAAAQTVSLQDIVVTAGSKGGLAGKVFVGGQPLGSSITLFDIDASTEQAPTLSGGVASVAGATLYVSSTAAAAINAVLQLTGSNALPTTSRAIKVGTLSITATGS